MTILSAQTIRKYCINFNMIYPFVERSKHLQTAMSLGLSPAGYDVRLDQHLILEPGRFLLGSTFEHFVIPTDILGVVHDKSTLARRGLAVQNTVIEPGWFGYLTLELSNHGIETIELLEGSPIAQILFHKLDKPTDHPYEGKYQEQQRGPQKAR